MSSSSPSLSVRSASTSASKITSASQEHRRNTYLTQNTSHTKGVEGLIAFLDGHESVPTVNKRVEEEDGLRSPPSSSFRQRGSLQPAFALSPSSERINDLDRRRANAVNQPQGQDSPANVETREARETTPTSLQHRRGSFEREAEINCSISGAPKGDQAQGLPSLDPTKSEIARLQQEVSSIQALMQELQSHTNIIRVPSSPSPFFPPAPLTSASQLASPEDILNFIRSIDSLANLRHRSGDGRRDEDIFTKNNLQKLDVRIRTWEKIARNR